MSTWIMHHGIQGQQWGVRNGPPYPLSRGKTIKNTKRDVKDRKVLKEVHTIPKGTKVYRVSSDKDEIGAGSTYVTYMNRDRDNYKGFALDFLKSQKGQSASTKMYESEYELTEDVTVPSREELRSVFNDLLEEKKHREAVGKAMITQMFDNEYGDLYYETVDSFWESYRDKHKIDPSDEEMMKYVEKEKPKVIAKYAEKMVKELDPDTKFSEAAWSLGTEKGFKSEVIKELKSRGYNAIVDEAGVGGLGEHDVREGVDPLIIFDRESSMKKISSKEVTEKEHQKAYKRSMKYVTKLNKKKPEW